MSNQNGQLILQALQQFDEPATITKIITEIANTAGVHPSEVKESVQETLNGGVRYGFIQKANRKYFSAPLNMEELTRPQSVTNNVKRDEDAEDDDDFDDDDDDDDEKKSSKRVSDDLNDYEELDETLCDSFVTGGRRTTGKRRRRTVSRNNSLRRSSSRRKRVRQS